MSKLTEKKKLKKIKKIVDRDIHRWYYVLAYSWDERELLERATDDWSLKTKQKKTTYVNFLNNKPDDNYELGNINFESLILAQDERWRRA